MAYGTVQINGKTYVEREQTFPLDLTMDVALGVKRPTLAFPGTADFWLKALTRETTVAGASADRRFKFRFGNSDGSTWYQSGGNGGSTDRVIDTCIFGNGPFPYVLNPYIFYAASGSIPMEVEDIANATDYVIHFAFRGSYLIPASA
jgi:hypothetical protein